MGRACLLRLICLHPLQPSSSTRSHAISVYLHMRRLNPSGGGRASTEGMSPPFLTHSDPHIGANVSVERQFSLNGNTVLPRDAIYKLNVLCSNAGTSFGFRTHVSTVD